jgi:UDP-glucose-4-epimerase GalE
MNILVVGGAGYIGSHMCKYLAQNGYTPIVLDNLVYGHHGAVRWGPFIEGSMENEDILSMTFTQYEIMAVMHFAAFAYVGESVTDPGKYYGNNVASTISLLNAMRKHNVLKFIFSSTCATYGEPIEIPIRETHPQAPINPYGRSKLMVEQILDDYQSAYGLNSISLRYFNAAGADPEGEIGEDHSPETHLIPLILQTALGIRDKISVFGDDYSTEDGTCVRDYIHVTDLSQAHLLALEKLMNDDHGGKYNLGNGDGHSVKQVIDAAREVTGSKIPSEVVERRPGDPAILIGSSEKAIQELGWKPQFADLKSILGTAWQWHKNNPEGYGA